MPSMIDLAGQIFGRLTVRRRSSARGSRGVLWDCSCSCGNQVTVLSGLLVHGSKQSCGCLAFEVKSRLGRANAVAIAGQRFGLLTAVKPSGKRQGVVWECLCDCGNTVHEECGKLRYGRRISCGCVGTRPAVPLRSERVRARQAAESARRRAGPQGGKAYTAAQIDALHAKQSGRCAEPTCRVPLGSDFHRDHTVPLALGGSNDIRNIQLLCTPCNLKKHAKHPVDWAREHGRLL